MAAVRQDQLHRIDLLGLLRADQGTVAGEQRWKRKDHIAECACVDQLLCFLSRQIINNKLGIRTYLQPGSNSQPSITLFNRVQLKWSSRQSLISLLSTSDLSCIWSCSTGTGLCSTVMRTITELLPLAMKASFAKTFEYEQKFCFAQQTLCRSVLCMIFDHFRPVSLFASSCAS